MIPGVITVPGPSTVGRPAVSAERLPELDGAAPAAVAEGFRDLPGLALLECGRPHAGNGWSYLTADPLAVATQPSAGSDPFAGSRALLARMAAPAGGQPGARTHEAPPFAGGLVGYLAYE